MTIVKLISTTVAKITDFQFTGLFRDDANNIINYGIYVHLFIYLFVCSKDDRFLQ